MPAGTEQALVEREAELEAVKSAVAAAGDGAAGRLLVVEGPAGIGKTQLLREARGAAEAAGMRVLSARGTELERDFPFACARQLFEPVLATARREERDELLSGAARPAAAVVGVDLGEDSVPAPDALADPSFATLNALYWLVSNLAEAGPALLLVDDAHWSDRSSLRFLRFLAPRIEDLAVLLVLAARPASGADDLDALVLDPAAHVLRPRPLTVPGVAACVRAALSPDAHEAFCAACAESSGGNPFLLRELLGELVAEGRFGTADEAAHVREVAPAGISRAVLVRLSRAPADARALAEAVAVLGDDAAAPHVAAFAGLDPEALDRAADALADGGIFERDRPLRFVHPLVRNAIYADMPPGHRAAEHRRAADLLAVEGALPERVAVHLLATPPGGDVSVAQVLLAAGERAIEQTAPEAAVRYLRRALDEDPPAAVRVPILRNLLTAGRRAGDRSALRGTEPLAELTADAETLVGTASELGMWMVAGGLVDEMAALLERAAVAAAQAGDRDQAMRLEIQRATWAQLPPAEARRRLAPHARDAPPDSPAGALWLSLRAWWISFLPGGSADEAAPLAERALRTDVLLAEGSALPQAAQAILVLIWAERYDAAQAAIGRYATRARARASLPDIANAGYLRAVLELRRGEVAQAAADARIATDTGRGGGFLAAVPVWLAPRVETLLELEELDEAEAELEASGMAGAIPARYWFTPVLLARARLRLEQGRPQEALDDARQGARDLEVAGIAANHDAGGVIAALALTALGRAPEALAVLDSAQAAATEWGARATLASVWRARGLALGGGDGLAALAEAVRISDSGLEHMRCLVDHGAALRRANRRAEAREPLRAVLGSARRAGAVSIARRAHAELAATGERARPLGVTGVESLTPSERRVAAMAAENLSNREIAQALFLTVKTIETHLSNAYRKLDIHSRGELPAALRDSR